MNKYKKEDLIAQAITEFGNSAVYAIDRSTVGNMALYAYADSSKDARSLRDLIPSMWNELYTIVMYTSDVETFTNDEEDYYGN